MLVTSDETTWPSTIGDLLEVSRTRLVLIHDVWSGDNHHSPIAAMYELRRGPRGALAGEARFSTAVTGERIVNITISASTTTRFLDGVAGARAVAGPYQPMIDHTDDCPSIEIALQVDAGELGRPGTVGLLFTESQGEFHAPWGACLRGELYTIPGDEIGRALAGLRRSLKRSVLDRMIREADRREARR
jgi:hypothetical protein